MNIELKLVDCI